MSRVWMVMLLAVLFGGVTGHWILEIYGDRGVDFWTGAAIHGIATLPYVFLCRAAAKGSYRPGFAHALLVVVALRLLALPLQPALSDDIYRYMHEGTMVRTGQMALEVHNPYLTPPANVADDQRHPEYWQRINHKEIPSAYPPSVQYALAVGVTISPTPLGMKVLFGACDVLIFVVLWLWLPMIGARKWLAIVHGFCPLMVLEFAGEGHSDSFTVLLVVLCLYAFSKQRVFTSSALLAVATLGKFLPVVLLPFVVRARWLAILPFLVVVPLLYLPFVWGLEVAQWPDLFVGATEYASRWRGNDSVFHVLHQTVVWTLGWLAGYGMDVGELAYYPHQIAKVPIVIFGTLLLLMAWIRRWPLPKVAAGVFMLFVSFTPTMHPWYLAFLVPFLCLYPSTLWLVFTGTIYLAYHVRPDWLELGKHIEEVGITVPEDLRIKVAEYIPFYLGFLSVLFDTRSGAAMDRESENR